jgi:hypothetical protein
MVDTTKGIDSMKQLVTKTKGALSQIKDFVSSGPTYRVANIEKDTNDEYIATIQIIGKNITFTAKPEEILADDLMTERFAPRDLRTLTYLGYLGMNSPKYKILAKRLSEDTDKMLFAIKKKGAAEIEVKTAVEISTNPEILKSLNQEDAHMVGHTTAMEHMVDEKAMKQRLLSQAKGQAE